MEHRTGQGETRNSSDGGGGERGTGLRIDTAIMSIAPKTFMGACSVLLPLPEPRGWVEIHCCKCKANSSKNGNYFAGITGLWSHLKLCSEQDFRTMKSVDGYNHVRAHCIKRELSIEEGEAVRANPGLIPKVSAGGAARDKDVFVPDTYKDLVAISNPTIQLEHLRACPVYIRHGKQWTKVGCYKCKATKSTDGQVFETLDAIKDHVVAEHEIMPPKRYTQLIKLCKLTDVDEAEIEHIQKSQKRGEKEESLMVRLRYSAKSTLAVEGQTIRTYDESVSFIRSGDVIKRLEKCPMYVCWHGQWYKLRCPECQANCKITGKFFSFDDLYAHVSRCDPIVKHWDAELRFERFARCADRVTNEEVEQVGTGGHDVGKRLASF